MNLQRFSFVFGCGMLISLKTEGAPLADILHIPVFARCLWAFRDRQRFRKGFLWRGALRMGVVWRLEPRAPSWEVIVSCSARLQQGLHAHARHPFLPPPVTVSAEEAGNVSEERACFHRDLCSSPVSCPARTGCEERSERGVCVPGVVQA